MHFMCTWLLLSQTNSLTVPDVCYLVLNVILDALFIKIKYYAVNEDYYIKLIVNVACKQQSINN